MEITTTQLGLAARVQNLSKTYGAGESFKVPGDSSFDIEVSGEPYHYICHYG